MGEVASCVPLLDPQEVIADLKIDTQPYPLALKEALIARFQWEIVFSIENAELALSRNEQTYIAGCVYRALSCIAQVLFAVNGRYLINEKGALAETETFPVTVPGVGTIASDIWVAVGKNDLAAAMRLLRHMERAMQNALTGRSPQTG
jgi:hypothetical protein